MRTDLFTKFGKNFILLHFYSLKLHLTYKVNHNYNPAVYYFLLGEREKYGFFNLSYTLRTLVKIKNFLKQALRTKSPFCFTSFNPYFFYLTKQLALETNQNYIIGEWVNGFFSKSLKSFFTFQSTKIKLKFNLSRQVMPILVFISFDFAETFFYETQHLNLPSIIIADSSNDVKNFSYPIICETISIETVFFYSRLLKYFFLNFDSK